MSDINEAVKILNAGGIVIYPTDTAFGIGCRMDMPQSVARLFDIRRRPLNQATPVLVSSLDMAEIYFGSPLPYNVRQLMEKYWPGALTIIYKCKEELIPSFVRGGGRTIGLRMPNHGVPLEIINKLGVPLLGPSANFHNKPTPFEYNELDKEFIRLVDYVIDGECFLKQASTVTDCTSEPFRIIREGAVKMDIRP